MDERLEQTKISKLDILMFIPKKMFKSTQKISGQIGQWTGSVGRSVTSNIRALRFESSHRQNFMMNIFTTYYTLKRRK